MRLGDKIKPYGELAAIGVTGGERHYWFVDKHGDVAMMPAYIFDDTRKDSDGNAATAED